MGKLATEVINTAGTQVGVTEATGHNDGPMVEQYLASVGLGKGNPWCMAFVYWCTKTAAAKLGLKNPLAKNGSVMGQWNSGSGVHITTPEQGAIIIFDHGVVGGVHVGHTGIITGVFPTYLHTIEGNTNDNGSREGIEVLRKTRQLNDPQIKGYIRLVDTPVG